MSGDGRAPAVASPCTNVCRIDPESGWCEGCGRTIGEIAGWSAAGDDERRRIVAALPGRLSTLAAREPRHGAIGASRP